MSETAGEEAKRAGRGGLFVLAAKVYFIGTGLVQQALLPRAIGLADYGAFAGRVLAVANVFNNVVVSSSTQGVSRVVAAAGEARRQALRATLRVHAAIALLAAGLLAGTAPLVARFQHAPEVLAPLLVMTGVLAVYGVYAPLIGYLNGTQQFRRQASLDIAAATLRTCLLLAVGWTFTRNATDLARSLSTYPGTLGAALGAVLAAVGVFLLAVRWTGTGVSFGATRPAGVPETRAYLALIVPVMASQLFTNAVMQADILMLGRYISIDAQAAHLVDPQKTANEWVGVYRACQLFAFLPYQLLFSVTQVLFPMLAKAKAEEGEARVKELVQRGSRIGAIVCGMLVCVVAAMPWSLVNFAYGKDVAGRALAPLSILLVGQAGFAMFGLAVTILVSLGRERVAMAITAVAVVLLVGSCAILIPQARDGELGSAHLTSTAIAATGALLSALVIATIAVRSAAGAFVPLKTALRVVVCVAAVAYASRYLDGWGKLVTPIVASGVVVAYFAALVLTRELRGEDLSLVLSVVKRRTDR